MNARERFLKTLLYGSPDRIPLFPGGPRESTLKAWRTQGLPEGADPFKTWCGILGVDPAEARPRIVDPGVKFTMIPEFEEKVLERNNGHLVVQDWKGNICEIGSEFDATFLRSARDFVTRRWIKCPVETREDWDKMKLRYDPAAPGRHPAGLAEKCAEYRKAGRDYLLSISFNGPFWQLREWLGFENLCILFLEEPAWIHEMISFWTDFVSETLKPLIQQAQVDCCLINEDMAYKGRSMISPAMTREFIQPAYMRWVGELKASGCKIIELDSDGFVGDLIPIWIESGLTTCSPMEVAAGCDLNGFRRTFGRSISFRGGVDKRKMARGGADLHGEIKRLSPVIQGGGYIPGCDHGVPPDISWPNFVEYGKLLAKECGWC